MTSPDESAYGLRLARKRSALSHPKLSCGCRNDGRTTYVYGCCDDIVCGVHGKGEHEHAEPPRAEPEPAPRFTEQPTRVSWCRRIADLEHPTTAELMAGVLLDGFLAEGAPIELERPNATSGNALDDLQAGARLLDRMKFWRRP